jgi:hypothetical protein
MAMHEVYGRQTGAALDKLATTAKNPPARQADQRCPRADADASPIDGVPTKWTTYP